MKELKEIESKNILDIGSGNLSTNNFIHSSNNIITIDYPITNKRYTSKPDIYSDARNLPFLDNYFDTVIIFEVLEHIFEDEIVIKETQRVLKQGGKLYISIPFMYPMHDIPFDFRRYTKYGITELLTQNNYDIEELTAHGNSIVTALQLFNLAILDLLNTLSEKHNLLTLFLSIILYPLMIFINLLSFPILHIKWDGKMNLGYHIVATFKNEQKK
jgi:SAM-dependent methyltransferase